MSGGKRDGESPPQPDVLLRLVGCLHEGDPDAGTLLETLYGRRISRLCYSYLGRWDDAEDARQDVFYKVLRRCRTLPPPLDPQKFPRYLYRSARNHCLNFIRNRSRRRDRFSLVSEGRWDAQTIGNLTRLVVAERNAHLMNVLADLLPAQREALWYRHVEGLCREDVAFILRATVETVKTWLYEGRRKVRAHASLMGSRP